MTFRNVGDSIGIINVLTHYAMIELLQDQQEDARRVLVEALEKSWALNARNELVVTYLLLSAYHLARGEWTRSMEMISLVDQQIQAWNISFPQHNQSMYENIHASLRQKLGDADYRPSVKAGWSWLKRKLSTLYPVSQSDKTFLFTPKKKRPFKGYPFLIEYLQGFDRRHSGAPRSAGARR